MNFFFFFLAFFPHTLTDILLCMAVAYRERYVYSEMNHQHLHGIPNKNKELLEGFLRDALLF